MAALPSPLALLLLLLAACCRAAAPASAPPAIALDGSTAAHEFDGVGGLSAGASSRLLIDYPEDQRSDILDLLFLPKFGAALQVLKVEVGGDAQSTDGSEPSHSHARGDLSCSRGWEMWLMREAKKRNPAIRLYGLSWAAPRWVGDGSGDGNGFFSGDQIEYQLAWLRCVRNQTGYDMNLMSTWNEKPYGGVDYLVTLRNALDAAGFAGTRLVVPDNGWGIQEDIVRVAEQNATFAASFDAIGLHYPCDAPDDNVSSAIGKKYWASEDMSTQNNWAGAGCWGRLLSQNYVKMNMTSTISWSLVWSAGRALPFFGSGLMLADEPWSGHYDGGSADPSTLNGPIFITAHTTQFAEPGWRYLSVPGGGSGFLPASAGNGSFVCLVPPNRSLADFTLIIEKLAGACLHCFAEGVADGAATFATAGGLAGPGTTLQVWRSNETRQFWRDADIVVGADSSFAVFVPRDSIVTISTVTGARHGEPSAPVPPSGPFPLPFAEAFDGYAEDATPRFFTDQQGIFAVRSGALLQVVPIDPGPNRWAHEDVDPFTLIGDLALANVTATVTASFAPQANASAAAATYVQLCGRIAAYTGFRNGPPPGACLLLNCSGGWVARAGDAVLASGLLPPAAGAPFDPSAPRVLQAAFSGAGFRGSVGGAPLFSLLLPAPFAAQGGVVGLGSGYHAAAFDDFSIVAATALPVATPGANAEREVPVPVPDFS
jgi:galactosylceramidase